MSECVHFYDPEYGQCIYCDRMETDIKRIAELEAELAKWKRCYEIAATAAQEYEARAEKAEAELASERTLAETAWRANADLVAANEKAEAEVERLNRHLRYHYPHPDLSCRFEGGGRESGDQGPGSVPGRPGRPAAANPAARKERDEG